MGGQKLRGGRTPKQVNDWKKRKTKLKSEQKFWEVNLIRRGPEKPKKVENEKKKQKERTLFQI